MAGPLALVTSSVGPSWPSRRGGLVTTDEDSPTTFSTTSTSPRRWTNAAPTAQMSVVPLSPISTEHEGIGGGISRRGRGGGACVLVDASVTVPPALRSASSSDGGVGGGLWERNSNHHHATYQDDEPVGAGGDMMDDDADWEHNAAMIPKTEPLEDDCFRLDDVQEAPPRLQQQPPVLPRLSVSVSVSAAAAAAAAASASGQIIKAKRPRGRPRKHPLAPQVANNKTAKGRSKTGCITCRKRKKKCDEAKPRCLNCEKNAVVCEGYHEKTLWKSGREKAEEERQRKQSLPHITLQPIFQGVETPEDRIFFSHYINHLSSVLTVEGQHRNAFKDMLLQMAVEHRGLMHSILSLAGKHIDFETPYGTKLLNSSPSVDLASLIARSQFHHNAAMKQLLAWGRTDEGAPEQKSNLAPRYGQMLCLLLQTAAEGSSDGAHRVHLQAYKSLIQENPPPDKAFTTFITEFFQYRVFADELIRYPDMQTKRLATEDWEPWVEIAPARLIGVGDGLFHHLAKITTIRNAIRANIIAKVEPVVDFNALMHATEIDVAIRAWAPLWPAGDNRDRVSLLYKQMMWVYLYRTIYPPSTTTPPPQLFITTTNGSDTRMPLSPASIKPCESTPLSPPLSAALPDRRNSYHSTTPFSADADSTPPPATVPVTRYPPQHDARISLAVDESLAILDSFKASDPVQTLLLVPCLIIGCAAFAPSQQERVRIAVRTVRGYTGLRNCDRVMEVLEEVWRLMGRAEWMRVWDWQGVARGMGLDFACA